MSLRACNLPVVVLVALIFASLSCLALSQPEASPDDIIPIESGPSYASNRYNTSRFHQACIYNSSYHCTCTSLWDSGCNCDGSDKSFETKNEPCDCASLCRELWKPNLPLTPLTQNQCHIPQVRRYEVKVFVSTDDKTSMNIIPYFQRLKEVMGPAVAIDIHYVVPSLYLKEGSVSKLAIMGALMARCALSLYPDASVSLPFISCLAQTKRLVPTLGGEGYNCTRIHTQVNYDSLRTCTLSTAGIYQLQSDYFSAMRYRIDSLPRVFMDDRSFHAGAGASYDVYEAALCYVFANGSRAFPWYIFYIMLAFLAIVILILFTIKRWSNSPFIENVQSIFMWNHHAATEQVDMLLYLRAYGVDEEEAAEVQNNENRGENEESNGNGEGGDESDGNASQSRRSRRRQRGRGERSRRRAHGDEADENTVGLEMSAVGDETEDNGDEDDENTRLTNTTNNRASANATGSARAVAYEDYEVQDERAAAATPPSARVAAPSDSQYVHDDLYENMPDYYHSSSDEEN